MESKKLIIDTPEKCMEILSNIIDNKYPEDKIRYASYVAMDYFAKNLRLFNKGDIEKVLSYENLNNKISSKLSYELLESAVQNNSIFPSYSSRWFQNIKANQDLLEKYLAILVNSHDNQQLKDFCHINPVLSKNYYLNNYPDNYYFEKYVISNNPIMIVQKRQLKEEDIIDLIEKGSLKYEHVKRIFSKFSYKVQTLISKNEIDFIYHYDLNKEDKTDLIELMSTNSAFFIKQLQTIDEKFTQKLLNANGNRVHYDNTSSQLNILQSVIENNKNEEKLKEIVAVCLYAYKDIFMKDLKVFLGSMEYEYTNAFLIYNYQRNHFDLFKCLAYFNDNLTEKEKDLVLTANFDNLLQSYDYKKNFPESNFDILKYIEPLTYFKHEELNKKLDVLKNKQNIDTVFILEVEKYLLHNKLNEKFIEKKTLEKRMKI